MKTYKQVYRFVLPGLSMGLAFMLLIAQLVCSQRFSVGLRRGRGGWHVTLL